MVSENSCLRKSQLDKHFKNTRKLSMVIWCTVGKILTARCRSVAILLKDQKTKTCSSHFIMNGFNTRLWLLANSLCQEISVLLWANRSRELQMCFRICRLKTILQLQRKNDNIGPLRLWLRRITRKVSLNKVVKVFNTLNLITKTSTPSQLTFHSRSHWTSSKDFSATDAAPQFHKTHTI